MEIGGNRNCGKSKLWNKEIVGNGNCGKWKLCKMVIEKKRKMWKLWKYKWRKLEIVKIGCCGK